MGNIAEFEKTALVMGILSSCPERFDSLCERLQSRYGRIYRLEGPFSFTFTHYYDEEMGIPIDRYFALFEHLVDPAALSDIKHETNELEAEFARDGKRIFNLDPGILSAGNFILATTKNRSHRVPLQKGMYAEVTLLYMNKSFQSFAWTYADYRSEQFKELFKDLRREYLELLKRTIG